MLQGLNCVFIDIAHLGVFLFLHLLFQGCPRQPRQTSERRQERQRQSRRQYNEALQGDS